MATEPVSSLTCAGQCCRITDRPLPDISADRKVGRVTQYCHTSLYHFPNIGRNRRIVPEEFNFLGSNKGEEEDMTERRTRRFNIQDSQSRYYYAIHPLSNYIPTSLPGPLA